ncbi:hypothetical protein [Streptomyces sp. CA-111067]|uniref:hypothetical protein n=1 Tax=Streptomyces sp. CA-111067 TaxID=3240046 RepID=UPI003D96DDD7
MPPGHAPEAPGPGGRRISGPLLLAVLAVAAVVVLLLVLTGNSSSHHGSGPPLDRHPAPSDDRRTTAGTYDFHAADTALVALDGVSGNVQVTADPHARGVTGSFHRSDGDAVSLHGTAVHDTVTGHDALAVTCDDENGTQVPCAGDLALTVPVHTGLRLRQTSGQTVLAGLGGDITVDASSVQLTASDLRPGEAHFTLVSGSADLSFGAPPDDFDLHETSASVTAHLPGSPDGYAVTTAASSASTQVTVPRNPASGHRVSLAVTSGSLNVSADAR